MENLIVVINDTKYLRFDYFLYTSDGVERLKRRLVKYNGIMQGAKNIDGGFFSSSYGIASVLIPEENVLLFNDELLDEI